MFPSSGEGEEVIYSVGPLNLEPALILALTKIRPRIEVLAGMPETSSVISLTGQNHINN
jgi:hypothetical protein